MKTLHLSCLVFLAALLAFSLPASATPPDIPWPSKEVMGNFHGKISEGYKEDLIRKGLAEKYVPGDAGFLDVIYDHQYVSIDRDGRQVMYRDSAVRANTPEAMSALGEYTARFNSATESVDILMAAVYLPDGSKVETDVSQCNIKEPFSNLIYSDLKVKTLSLKGIAEGSVLRVMAKRTYQPDVDKGFTLMQLFLDTSVPVKESLTVLRLEKGTSMARKEILDHPLPTLVSKVEKTEGDETYYLYGISDLKAQVPEAASVPPSELSNRILFASPKTWDEVAQWWSRLYEPKVSTNSEIKEKALELTRDLPDTEQKIKALYDYVKSVRYVAIHLNEGAYVPHSAEETLNNKYGDCKDKSVLLLSLLRSIGVDGVVALVRVASLIDKDLPSPKYFDHAVVAMPSGNHTYTFLDATGSYTPYGLLPEAIQYRHALIPRGNGGELFLIPSQTPEMNMVEETIEADVEDVRTVTLTGRSRTYSSKEWYHMLPSIPQPLLLQAIKETMAAEYKDFDVLSFRVEPPDNKGFLNAETKFKIRDFTKKMGNVYIFNPLFDADKLGYESVVGPSERKSAIELDGPKKLVVTTTVKLPPSVTVDALPKPFSVENDKFGSYSYEVSQSEGMLRIRREIRIAVKRVSAEDYAEFRAFSQSCLSHDEELIGLRSR